jgi:hypothetical protein
MGLPVRRKAFACREDAFDTLCSLDGRSKKADYL